MFGGHASLEPAERVRVVGHEVYPQFGSRGDEPRQFQHVGLVAAVLGTVVLVAGNQLHVIVTAAASTPSDTYATIVDYGVYTIIFIMVIFGDQRDTTIGNRK